MAAVPWQVKSASGRGGAEEERALPAALAAGEGAGQPAEGRAAHGAGVLPPEAQRAR